MDEELIVAIDADTTGVEAALERLEKRAMRFGDTITNALKGAIIQGKSLEDTLRGVAMALAGDALETGLAPLQNMLTGVGRRLFGGFSRILPFADGGVASTGAFMGAGGVVNAPAYFPAGDALGLMGEAGPEAILPLQRTASGRLGVAANMEAGQGTPVIVNITTPDIAGFQRSQSQVSTALARAVARGRRGV